MNILKQSLAWANCVAVCTDSVAALTGSNKGFRGLIQKVAPHMVFNHCMIHRQALVAKDMDEDLHNILQDAVSSSNHIKCNSLNSRLFSILCYEMGSTHIEKLKEKFSRRFIYIPEKDLVWIRDPFPYDICSSTLQIIEKEQLIDLISDYTLRNQFKTQPCQKLWLSVEKQYPVLCKNAIRLLIQFASTYLCETGFSKLVSIKTKYRSRSNPEDDMRIAISNIHNNKKLAATYN
ncbi:zinc finger MYM-type protein 6 [Trichonephila clavipes]|nr:zinc finger MYM-type protein 6 [Trichonephila clavipes]